MTGKILIFLVILSFFHMVLPVYAGPELVNIVVPATGQTFRVRVIIEPNGRVLAPLRTIIEALGKVDIQWEPEEGMVTATTAEHWCQCWIGKNKATADGESVYLDTPPFTYNGRTYVPLRFIGESLGKQVEWDYMNKAVTIK
jgi:hypothetical protein